MRENENDGGRERRIIVEREERREPIRLEGERTEIAWEMRGAGKLGWEGETDQ